MWETFTKKFHKIKTLLSYPVTERGELRVYSIHRWNKADITWVVSRLFGKGS